MTRSTIEGGRGCSKYVPVLRGNGTKIAPIGDLFDQPSGGINWIRVKLAGHVRDHVVLSPEVGVLVTFPGTESLDPRPPQSLNNSCTERTPAPSIIGNHDARVLGTTIMALALHLLMCVNTTHGSSFALTHLRQHYFH